MIMLDNNIKIRDYIFIILLYVCVALSIVLDEDNYIFIIDNVYFQIILLCCICFILNLLLLASSNQLFDFFQLVLYYIIVTLIIKLYVGSISLRFWLAAAFFYTAAIKFPHRVSIFLSLIFFLHMFLLQLNCKLYGIKIDLPKKTLVWFLFAAQFFLFIVSQINKYYQNKIRNCEEDLILKEKSINFLADTNLGFQEYAIKIESESRIEERLNITREIHDITGYTLTSISMMLEYGEDLIHSDKKDELIELLSTARQQARKGHAEIRSALKQLRSIKEKPVPFFYRIKEIVDNFKKITDMEITLELSNLTSKIGKKYDHLIIRFLQEGLTNAFRHGRATKIKIVFYQDVDSIIINLEDNGVGASQVIEGIGLIGMKERINECGGTLVYHIMNQGFNLTARLPLE